MGAVAALNADLIGLYYRAAQIAVSLCAKIMQRGGIPQKNITISKPYPLAWSLLQDAKVN
jgi:hypothetical protein